MLALLLCITGNLFALEEGPEQEREIGERPRVALVLAGGAAWGLAHIGVIRVMEELCIPIDLVVGTSIGSIVGGLYAGGYNAEGLYTIFENADWNDLFSEDQSPENRHYNDLVNQAKYAASLNFDRSGFYFGGGLLSGRKVLRLVDTYLLNIPNPVNFDELPRRYRAVATDIETGERKVFSSGSVPDAIRASMSIPGVFSPWNVEGHYYIDGGVVDNLAIDVARDLGADIVIAVDLFDSQSFKIEDVERGVLSSVQKTLDIFVANRVRPQFKNADLLIRIDVAGYSMVDFSQVEGLSALGERQARDSYEQLLKIKDRFPPSEASPSAPDLSLALSKEMNIHISGATNKDRTMVRKEFFTLAGSMPDVDLITHILKKLDETGRYGSIRIRRDSSLTGTPLLISLEPRPPEKNALRLNLSYTTTFSTLFNVRSTDLVPAVVINNIGATGSQLLVDAELLDSPGIEISFILPLGSMFSLRPFFSLNRQSSIRFSGSYVSYQLNTLYLDTGVDVSFYPFAGFVLGAGWSFIHSGARDIEDRPLYPEDEENNHIFRTFFGIQRLDSPIFPSRGLSASAEYRISLRNAESSAFFRTLTTEGFITIPIGTPFSLGLRWKGGSDFSFGAYGNRAPFTLLPSLASRWMFPGPLLTDEETGSHVMGAGLEIKYRLNWRSKGITLPAFMLIHGAAGAVLQDADNIDWGSVFHWNASAGLGLRVNHAFGVSLRGGIHQGTDKKFSPYLALDIGSIGK